MPTPPAIIRNAYGWPVFAPHAAPPRLAPPRQDNNTSLTALSTKPRPDFDHLPEPALEFIASYLASGRALGPWAGAPSDLIRFASLSRSTRRASVPHLFHTVSYVGPADWESAGAALVPSGLKKSALLDNVAAQEALTSLSVADIGPQGSRTSVSDEAWSKAMEDGEALVQVLQSRAVMRGLRHVRIERCHFSRTVARRIGYALANIMGLRSLSIAEVKEHVELGVAVPAPVAKASNSLECVQVVYTPGLYGSAVEVRPLSLLRYVDAQWRQADGRYRRPQSLMSPDLSNFPSLRSLVLSRATTCDYKALVALLPRLQNLAVVDNPFLARALLEEVRVRPRLPAVPPCS